MVDLIKIKKMQEIIEKNKYEFNDAQMNEIHNGMQKDIDFLIYLNPNYSAEQMKLIRIGLEEKIDVNKYADPNFSFEKMRNIYDSLHKSEQPKIEQKSIENKHEHNFKKIILKQPTCTAVGKIKEICTICGKEQMEDIPMTKHNFTTTRILPTCKHKGYTTYRCITCGYTYNDDFTDTVQHTYSSEIIEQPTCKRPGKILYTCVNCGHTYEEEMPVIDHIYEEKEIAPTCIEEGYTLHTCTMCGNSYRDNIKEKIPHAYTNWERIKEPTCTEKGIEEQVCLRCKTKNTKFIDPLGHNYIKKIKEPTCTEKGEIRYICSRCNDQYVDEYIDTIPHDLTKWEIVKQPTLRTEGLKACTCKMCNKKFTEKIPCKKMTMKSVQEERLNEIYKNKKSNKMKFGFKKEEINFEPIKASYTEEQFEQYTKKLKLKFDPKQTLLIKEGLAEGLDVKIYADPKYTPDIMYEIKKGLEHGINLSKYAKQFDPLQINEIRLGIEHNVDIKKYLNKNFSNSQMREIRLGLEEGLNVKKLASLDGCPDFLKSTPIGNIFQPKYSAHDMYEKRADLINKKNDN